MYLIYFKSSLYLYHAILLWDIFKFSTEILFMSLKKKHKLEGPKPRFLDEIAWNQLQFLLLGKILGVPQLCYLNIGLKKHKVAHLG